MYTEIQKKDNNNDKLNCSWKDGTWLEHAPVANETLVGKGEGVVQ